MTVFNFFLALSLVATDPFKLVIIGDSISDGYGVSTAQTYTEILSQLFKNDGMNVDIQNASVSGSLTSSAPGRARWALKNQPQMILIQLGGNDALKATPISQIRVNLQKALDEFKGTKTIPALVEMKIFGNFGADYSKSFEQLFPNLARENKVILLPFLLQGIAGKSSMNQADGIHPNANGHKQIADNLYKTLKSVVMRNSSPKKASP